MIAIGFDIGGTQIKGGALDDLATRHAEIRETSPAQERPEELVALLASMIRRIEEQAGQPIWQLGIGCAGLIDSERGIVRTSPNLPRWENVPLAEWVLERAGRRPVVLNDANAFALAEARLGAAQGARHVVGLTLGTGVGGGLILEGRLWTGTHGYAGEFGHVPLLADGPLCACGARGCLEALIGTRAILSRYAQAMAAGGGVDASTTGAGLTPRDVADRARRGDPHAVATFRETGRFLGLALGGVVHLLDPEVIVIGGGISASADLLLPAAREAMAAAVMLPAALLPPIVPAALGNSAGWIGAALAALESR